MPQRIPINEEQHTSLLRRSPRLYQKNQIKAEATKNPKTEKRRSRAPFSDSPSSLTPKVSLKKNTLKHQPRESPQKLRYSLRKSTRFSGKRNAQKISEQEGLLGIRKSELGDELLEQISKKSATRSCNRGNANANAKIASVVKTGKGKGNASIRCTSIETSTQRDFPYELEKRVTRSSSREKTSINASNQFSEKRGLSVRDQPKVVKSSKQCIAKLEKKIEKNTDKPVHRNGSSNGNEFIQCGSTEILDKRVFSGRRSKLVVNLSEEFTRKLRNRTRNGAGTSSPVIEEKDVNRGNKQIGVKRKRNEVEEEDNGIIVNGWNADQEMALQRAYLATKPTPHFWKKVARLVPGKSAQECFDKVHSDHLTPPQLQPRTRARTNSSSSLSSSLSPTNFLKFPVLNVKNKRKSHLAHKTLRQLLQKSYQVDPNYEADLFSVLEPTLNPPPVLSTPERKPESLLKKCLQRSSSSSLAHKKQISRFGRAGLVSPPVLKQVKNKVLHEKYIDQLRSREAKRNAVSSRELKHSKKVGKEDRNVGHTEKIDAIKAAKNALVFEARDAINQFQNIQAHALSSSFSDEDEYEHKHEEEEEEEDEDEDEDEDRG